MVVAFLGIFHRRGAWEQVVVMWDLVPTLKLGVGSGYKAKKS